MGHVLKNVRTFDDIVNLPSDDIDAVLNLQDTMITIFAKALVGSTPEKLASLQLTIPKWTSPIKDELSFLTDTTAHDQEAAKFYILKALRKLQNQETIGGFRWSLPPQEVFSQKVYPDGKCQIHFENGVLAAEGEFIKNQRLGFWRHFYETGRLLAEGDYSEGLKSGMWIFYHGNGLHKSQGKYKADLKQGFWKEWDRNGNVEEVEYHEGTRKT